MEYSFTVFTPTYNRAHTLEAVYSSLKNQTYRNFEWLIIDDGSSDDTAALIRKIKASSDIEIVYIYQENQGKHIAQNKAIEVARGELFLPLDSDDTITEDALETLWKAWMSIDSEKRLHYSGIGCHCKDKNGALVGDEWPEAYIESNDLEMHFKYQIKGEKWGPIRTDVMREFPNKVVKGHFLSENYVWFQIAEKYSKIYIPDMLRIYEVNEDSVTKKQIKKDYNLESREFTSQFYINRWYGWYFKYYKSEALKMPLRLNMYGGLLHRNFVFGKNSIIHSIQPIFPKTIAFLGFPVYLIYRFK